MKARGSVFKACHTYAPERTPCATNDEANAIRGAGRERDHRLAKGRVRGWLQSCHILSIGIER